MDVLDITKKLVAFNTVNPPGTQRELVDWLGEFLNKNGIKFKIFEVEGVPSLIAELNFGKGPSICLCGHWDVVPIGEDWTVTKPFTPLIKNGKIYGRGTCDMKGGLAAMIATLIKLKDRKDLTGRILLLAAGDEEKGGFRGASKVLDKLGRIDYAIIGEPSNFEIKVARRGVIWATVKVYGKSGHASRPEEGKNALEDMARAILAIKKTKFSYKIDPLLPKPTLSPTVARSGEAQNVIPGLAEFKIDIRHTAGQTKASVYSDIKKALDLVNNLKYDLELEELGKPFKAKQGKLIGVVSEAVKEVVGKTPKLVGKGGASDARFFAEKGIEVLEVGVEDSTLHQPNENCQVDDIYKLEEIYVRVAEKLLSTT